MRRVGRTRVVSVSAICFVAGACAAWGVAGCDPNPAGPRHAATLIAERGDVVWDYVALGDSTPAGAGVRDSYVDYYAEHIADDLGITIRTQNWAKDGQTSSILLDELKTNPKLRTALGEAEIITIWIGWNDLGLPLALYREDRCGGTDGVDCVREAVVSLNSNLDSILDEILSLRGPEDTLIRISDTFNPFVELWTEQGTFQLLCAVAFEGWRGHIIQAASERKITVVHTSAAINGPSGEQAASAKGILQADGLHFNEQGHRLISQLHREAGYEYPVP